MTRRSPGCSAEMRRRRAAANAATSRGAGSVSVRSAHWVEMYSRNVVDTGVVERFAFGFSVVGAGVESAMGPLSTRGRSAAGPQLSQDRPVVAAGAVFAADHPESHETPALTRHDVVDRSTELGGQ